MQPLFDESLFDEGRMCQSKKRYTTLKDARTALNLAERKRYRKGTLRPYLCPLCNGFHLTHSRSSYRQKYT